MYSTPVVSVTVTGATEQTGDAFQPFKQYDIVSGAHNQSLNIQRGFSANGTCTVRFDNLKEPDSTNTVTINKILPRKEWSEQTAWFQITNVIEVPYFTDYTLSSGIYTIPVVYHVIPFGRITYDEFITEVTGDDGLEDVSGAGANDADITSGLQWITYTKEAFEKAVNGGQTGANLIAPQTVEPIPPAQPVTEPVPLVPMPPITPPVQ